MRKKTTMLTLEQFGVVTESVQFQSDKFFQALVKNIDDLRDNADEYSNYNDKKFFKTKEIKDILKTIQSFTNINLIMEEGGPATIPPILDTNHVFYREQREDIKEWKKYWYSELPFVEKAMKALDTKIVTGSVDLKEGKVAGVFAMMEMPLFMPQEMLLDSEFMSSQEIAAIILHEVGHCFTFFEYVSRSISTNQVLSVMVRSLDKSVTYEDRVVVLQKGAEKLKLDKTVQDELKKCESPEQLTIVTVAAAAEQCVSELGYSIYEANSCEQLADQYATRMGAGIYLVTALDKLLKSFKWPNRISMFIFYATIVISIIYSMGLMAPLWLLILIAGPDKELEIYDNDFSRFDRIKRDIIERIKVAKPSEKLALTQQVDQINVVLKNYADTLDFWSKVAYMVRPGYRAAHNAEKLQKDLERIASNELFVAAAKLQSLG